MINDYLASVMLRKYSLFIIHYSLLNKQQLHDNVNRQQHDERELDHVAEERRHVDTLLLSDRLHHEVGSVANIGQRAKEDGTH